MELRRSGSILSPTGTKSRSLLMTLPQIAFLLCGILVAAGVVWLAWQWQLQRFRGCFQDQGLTLVRRKWLPFGPGGRRGVVFFVNYRDAAGQLFRARAVLVAGYSALRQELFLQMAESILTPDEPGKFTEAEKERWFYDPAAIYRPD